MLEWLDLNVEKKQLEVAEQSRVERLRALAQAQLELPTMPFVARKVVEMTSSDRHSSTELARTIEADQRLALEMMRMASSPGYGMTQPVKTLRQAISVLGQNEVRAFAVSISMQYLFARPTPLARRLWEHAFNTSLAARIICSEWLPEKRDEAFLAALLHDIGMVTIETARPAFYDSMPVYADSPRYTAYEFETLGFSHADVGALVLDSWKMPPAVRQAVALHEDLELAILLKDEAQELVAVLTIADWMGNPNLAASTEELPGTVKLALEVLRMKRAHVDQVLKQLRRRISVERATLT